MEIRIALQPKQILFDRSLDTIPVTLYGGAKGGGKSAGLRKIFLKRRFQYPKSIGAIFRRSYPELESNHIQPLFSEYPDLRQYYNDSKKDLTLPNGSVLKFRYAKSIADLDNHQGAEYHDLGIEEAGQWTEAMFRKLHGSNRSSIPGVKARCALTGNPGGIGHGWLKRLFITKRYNERERASDYNFIPAFVRDNQALMENDPDYIRRLEAEPNEALRKAYLYGDWDIIAGAFFTELSREVHFIKPFAIPDHWVRFGSYDFGFNHPAAFGWYAVDEDGNVYKYREFCKAKHREDQQAAVINSFDDTQKLEYIVAGHDCWQDRGASSNNSAPTIAERFSKHGLHLSRASIGRIQGANQVRDYLSWQGRNGEANGSPRFFIFETCPITFDCLTRMQHDENRLEDVLKVDAEDGDPFTGDDAYDETRMALMSRPPVAIRNNKPKAGTPQWLKKQEEEMEQAALRSIQGNGDTFSDDPWSKNIPEFDNR